ncbi:uncharacterized protein BO88DRAFT_450368 [Aspergillus vadensis CBS 113365]|uniref:Uncharacterized protein n=1 Tax=Aspergillus vadensis (strain CBS 113365 / IMI 142717 / IBT 24658) TaxID=1448311 RepID=A0A319BM74_ASPVC|nr:hypothetical protein BO88DRAFT_450368 [Aspergillus vadensis CBS 113365]PYH72999.1 hypothetical protein BO88DRAFT_450368 [Aspergillus vadensis CBS 113365]
MSIVPPFDLWRRPYPEISSKHSITVYVNSSHLSPLTLATYLASLWSWIPKLGSSSCQTGNPVQTEPQPGIRLLHPLRGVHLISQSVLRDPFPVQNVVQQMWSSPDGVVCAFSIPRYSGEQVVPLNSAQGRGRGSQGVRCEESKTTLLDLQS